MECSPTQPGGEIQFSYSTFDKHPSTGISNFKTDKKIAFAHRHQPGMKDKLMLLSVCVSVKGGVPEDGTCVEAYSEGTLRLAWRWVY